MSRVRLGLIACALSAVVSATSAGTISIDTISGPSRDLPFQARAVRLTGVIDEGDAETLRRILTQLRAAQRAPATLLMIELSSRGGDLYEGIRLGNLIH
ncbi:MAG TPA: hypothetical protein VF915_25890, partial [Reyranella sp.]